MNEASEKNTTLKAGPLYNNKSGWSKFVGWVFRNMLWFAIFLISIVAILMAFFGTWHRHSGVSDIPSILSKYEGYISSNGKDIKYDFINDARVLDIDSTPEEDRITISEYYNVLRKRQEAEAVKVDDLIAAELAKVEPVPATLARLRAQRESINVTLDSYDRQLDVIASGAIDGFSLNTWTTLYSKYEFYGEYDFTNVSKFVMISTSDPMAWFSAVMYALMAFLTKVLGRQIGQRKGFTENWTVTLYHSNLASLVSPLSTKAELLCIGLNREELKAKRIEFLDRVSLKYTDVFDDRGMFLAKINFVEIPIVAIKKPSGKIIYKLDKDLIRIRKKQIKMIKFLKNFKIKELHIANLMSANTNASDRFDLGTPLNVHNTKKNVISVITSMVTVMPLISAIWIFADNPNKKTQLLVTAGAIAINFVMMLFNIGSEQDYISTVHIPMINKRNDFLLELSVALNLATEREIHWYNISDSEKLRGKTLEELKELGMTKLIKDIQAGKIS